MRGGDEVGLVEVLLVQRCNALRSPGCQPGVNCAHVIFSIFVHDLSLSSSGSMSCTPYFHDGEHKGSSIKTQIESGLTDGKADVIKY